MLDGNEQNPRIKLFETFGASVLALISGDVDTCLLYTSDAADDLLCVDPGGRRIIKKKNNTPPPPPPPPPPRSTR